MGRIAMVAFAVSCGLEIFTADHLGPIRQVRSGSRRSPWVPIHGGCSAGPLSPALSAPSPYFVPPNHALTIGVAE